MTNEKTFQKQMIELEKTKAIARAHPQDICQVPNPSARLTELCKALSPIEPQIIPSKPFGNARMAMCYHNVETVVLAFGGRMVWGWSVWEDCTHFYFERHAIWESPKGELFCVTPQLLHEKAICFLEYKRFDTIPDIKELDCNKDLAFPSNPNNHIHKRIADLKNRAMDLFGTNPGCIEYDKLQYELHTVREQYVKNLNRPNARERAKLRKKRCA